MPVTMPLLELPPERSARDLKVGDSLGKLLLTDAMGEGATGKVFRALHQSLKIPVAVKILQSAELERDPGLRAQLRAEAQLLAQLNHPNIIRVWDYEDNPELPYVVLEIVEGLSLAELIAQSGRLAPRHALDIVTQVADGLAAAFRLGIIHRDVKPSNILITKARVPKLVDLGLAVVSAGGGLQQSATDSGRLVDIVGTPAYMAPEQFLAPEQVDHRSDIYSLGVTFFHAVTGRLPFDGGSARAVMLNKVQHTFPPPHEMVPGLSAALSQVVLHMMQRESNDRYQDYDDLLIDLKALRQALQTSSSELRVSSAGILSRAADEPSPVVAPPSLPAVEIDTAQVNQTQKVAQAPVLPARLVEAAQAAARGNDKGRARELLHHALRLEPNSEPGWLWLASVEDTPDAKIEALRHVLDLNPKNDKARSGLATIALQAGVAEVKKNQRDKAHPYFIKATEAAPRVEAVWLWRARTAPTRQEAAACLQRALEINPDNEAARASLAKAQAATPPAGWTCPLCRGEAAKAPKTCPKCGALLVLADLASWRARTPLPIERVRDAETRYAQALAKKPDAPTHLALALVYLNIHRFDRANQHLASAVRLRPNDAALARHVATFANQLAAPAAAPRGWQGTVLVVDDSPTIRKVVSRSLAEYDYRIAEASDGEEALASVRRERPDLVLLDICMPGMDGYEVCRSLRANPATANLPILMLSGKDGIFDKLRGRMAGSTEYLTKPFRPEVLVQVVEKYCLKKRAARGT